MGHDSQHLAHKKHLAPYAQDKIRKPVGEPKRQHHAFGPLAAQEPVDVAADDREADDFDNVPALTKLKPKDQLDLCLEELEKEVPPRVLYPQNPRAPKNITQFSFKDRQFKRDDQIEQTVYHLSIDGFLWPKNSVEAIAQDEFVERKTEKENARQDAEKIEVEIENDDNSQLLFQHTTLRNQFNFSSRGCQTFDIVLRERGVSTEPPPYAQHTDTVTQWAIYDQYMAEMEASHNKETTHKLQVMFQNTEVPDEGTNRKKTESDPLYSENMKWSIKLMSRIVNQNAENDIYHDFKYFEDRSDVYREGSGTLLPLWRFASDKSKRKQVTALKWNPQYPDLFAAAFGCYQFLKQGTGVICCYSLKNTHNPEYAFHTDSGVCCLDWHAKNPALLAVGMYDGTVQVFDVRSKQKKPMYSSSVRSNKHTDPVWEVRWNEETCSSTLGFYSISCDGRVTIWSLMKDKLDPEEVMELKLSSSRGSLDQDDDVFLTGLDGGTCFDFNKLHEHLFLVGTEEGKIHKCSKAYSGQYLQTYDGHSLAVYAVRWNPFHPQIFISASADWTVKIWDHTAKAAVMTLDLGQAVGDVAWAPYSSTVFAAVISDGIVHIYDLEASRHERICEQKVVKKAQLTHVAFSNEYPIIIVGDDRGGVNCLKLSPNLRKREKKPNYNRKTFEDEQVVSMERFLSIRSES